MYTLSYPRSKNPITANPDQSGLSNRPIVAVYHDESGNALWVNTTIAGLIQLGSSIESAPDAEKHPLVSRAQHVKRGAMRPSGPRPGQVTPRPVAARPALPPLPPPLAVPVAVAPAPSVKPPPPPPAEKPAAKKKAAKKK
jgi:hypothetical protein